MEADLIGPLFLYVVGSIVWKESQIKYTVQ